MRRKIAELLNNILITLEQHHINTFKDVCHGANISEQELKDIKIELGLILSRPLMKFRGGWDRKKIVALHNICSDFINDNSEESAIELLEKIEIFKDEYVI